LTGPQWQRIVTSHSRRNSERDEVYLFKEGDKVAGVVILVAEAKELTVVNIVGLIDVDRLYKLGGHFGIPDEFSDGSKHKNGHQIKRISLHKISIPCAEKKTPTPMGDTGIGLQGKK